MPTNKSKYLWKFLHLQDRKIVSDYDKKLSWKINEWKTAEGIIKCCKNGFHASKGILQALNYVGGDVLAKVEVKGTSDEDDDKEAWSDMRIVKAYEWTKIDSVKLAVFSAYQCLEIFEKRNPNDDRPRKAIEAAEAYIKNPTKDAADATYAAYAAACAADAAAAYAAAYAADAAAYAAYAADAADAADVAADAAAYAADAAAAYAADATYAAAADVADAAAAYAADATYAAADATLKKIEKWLISHVKNLNPITK